MAAPIVDATGLHVPTIEEVLLDFVTEERATISAQVDTEADAMVGQLNGVIASALRVALEAMPVAYNAFDPANADFNRLKALSQITGTEWRDATYGRLEGTRAQQVALNIGTTLPAGSVVSDGSADPAQRWESVEDFGPVPSSGNYFVTFQAQQPGPIPAPAGTLTTIETPVSGWSSTINPEDAVPGLAPETEEELRARRTEEISRLGGGTADAIAADVRDLEEDGRKPIQDITVLVNDEDVTDTNGLLPHSIHVILYDGITEDATDEGIARAIFETKGAGVNTNGSELEFVEDSFGTLHPIRFSRVTLTPLTLAFDLVTNEDYPGTPAFASAVATASIGIQRNGGDYLFSKYITFAQEFPGVINVNSVVANGNPPNTNLAATPFQRYTVASFDVSVI